MKKLKKAGIALRVILFFLIFLFLFQNASLLFVYEGGTIKRRMRGFYNEPKNSIDVVLIGPSSVYPFFIPGYAYQEYGLVTYDYAIPALRLSMIPYAIAEVKKEQNPKLYVIDIRAAVTNKDALGDEAALRRMINNMKFGRTKVDAINTLVPKEERLSYYLGMIKFHERWKELNRDDLNTLLRKTDPTKGYDARTKIFPAADIAWTENTEERVPLKDLNEEYLRKLLAHCKDNNINVLFTAAPWSMTETRKKRNSTLKDIVEEYGFTLLDANNYYEEMDWDFNTDLGDNKHSNVNGATKYTKFLTEYLVEHYDFEDRRQDPKYEKWSHAYDLYKQSYSSMQEKLEARKQQE